MNDRQRYVQQAIELYKTLIPGQVRPRTLDRQLASTLYDRTISLETLETAIRLALARRESRTPDAALPPIRSLHYFLPVLDEIKDNPKLAEYLDYLKRR